MNVASVLGAVRELIVRSCDPDEIVLFGSYAKGTSGRESDLDILVIGDFRESRWLRARELEGLLGQIPMQIDVHLVTRDEMAAETLRSYSFLSSVRVSAVTLYRRPAAMS